MNLYLQSVGWWNMIGSLTIMGFVYEPFGKKIVEEWAQIFKEEYSLTFYGKLWCVWAAGINVFFGLVNILSVHWDVEQLKVFCVWSDIVVYLVFIFLAVWGHIVGRCGPGIWVVYCIFGFWIIWGVSCII